MGTRVSLERLDVGHQVSELPIGMDQIGGGGPRSRGHRRARRDRPLAAGEDERPAFVDGARIATVLLIQGLEILGVRPGDRVEHVHGVVTGELCHN